MNFYYILCVTSQTLFLLGSLDWLLYGESFFEKSNFCKNSPRKGLFIPREMNQKADSRKLIGERNAEFYWSAFDLFSE